jgi:hypothetical protein
VHGVRASFILAAVATEAKQEAKPLKRRLSRRRLLRAAIGGAVLVATGSIVALLRTRGYVLPPERVGKLAILDAAQFTVIEHAARRIAARDRDDAPTPDDVDVAGFVDRYVAGMHPRSRTDLFRFLTYVEQVAPLAAGHASRFTRLAPADQDRVLSRLESSDNNLLRAGFAGLKALVFMGYYRDPRTWKVIAYDGPRVGRPAAGWSP